MKRGCSSLPSFCVQVKVGEVGSAAGWISEEEDGGGRLAGVYSAVMDLRLSGDPKRFYEDTSARRANCWSISAVWLEPRHKTPDSDSQKPHPSICEVGGGGRVLDIKREARRSDSHR